MAKKEKTVATEVSDSLDISSFFSGIDGVSVLTDAEILNTRKKIRSKVEILNCLLGGGRPYGSITGSFGPPSGGKSTEAYEAAAEFLRVEPDGVVVILDQEASADPSRINYLGVDSSRVLRIKSESINTGFTRLIQLLDNVHTKQIKTKKRIPIFVVWDTITKGKAEDDEDASRMGARNRARVIKARMNDLNPWLDKVDVILILLNQVIQSQDKYGNEIIGAGGGVGLRHDEHLRLYLKKGKTNYDETGMAISDMSSLDLDKTKLSPKMRDIPLIFDVIHGGRIDEELSFLTYFQDHEYLKSVGGWWNIHPILDMTIGRPYANYLQTFSGNKRIGDWIEIVKTDRMFYLALRLTFMDIIGGKYELQRLVMEPYYTQLLTEFTALEDQPKPQE